MEDRVIFDASGAAGFFEKEELDAWLIKAEAAKRTLLGRKAPGAEYTGWIDIPENYDKEEFERIKKAALKIRSDSEVLVVIGIGGSYLGARAAIEFLSHSFMNMLEPEKRQGPQIFFAGNSLSSVYLNDLLDVIGDRDFSVNVISKSGTTTEPAVAFRVFKKKLEEKYGKDGAARRIYATTDSSKGALKALSVEQGYETFTVPDDTGGRYSVLTAVGLLPIAAAGCDIDALMRGASEMRRVCTEGSGCENPALMYAALRNLFYKDREKSIELFSGFEPSLHYVAEWWKQLFGESEGKDGKGLYPASVDLTTDLHSMGQYIQDGRRLMFETMIDIKDSGCTLIMEKAVSDTDGLNYLAGKTVGFVNGCALGGTVKAHTDGGVPVLRIVLPSKSEFSLGQLFYFFEFACGVSGYMLGVNPFDQPGVESYKRNMFTLLGKPGSVQNK